MMPLAALPAFALGGAVVGPLGPVVASNLPVANAPIRDAMPVAPVTAWRDADGLFYLTARVDGWPVRFAVDTGASVVVLSQADATRAGIAAADIAPGIATANGPAAMATGEAHSLLIGGRRFGPVPVTIAPQGSVSLIGENILARYREIRIDGNRMELR